jgi:hypothetical protein
MAQLDMGNGFSIDYDDIPKFIAALQDQQHRLRTTLQTHDQALKAPAPANDGQSVVWSGPAGQSVGSYRAWSIAQQNNLQALINNVNAAVASYKQTEQNNTMRP